MLWKEEDGYPEIAIMKWKGDENVRATARERFIRDGAKSLRGPLDEHASESGRNFRDRNVGRGEEPSGDAIGRGDRGAVRDSDSSRLSDGIRRVVSELRGLPDSDLENLGLSRSDADDMDGGAGSSPGN